MKYSHYNKYLFFIFISLFTICCARHLALLCSFVYFLFDLTQMQQTYNSSSGIYNCDPFNEERPANSSAEYLGSVARNIYDAVVAADARAIW